MKNKYRFLSMLLASALASAMLTGCGSSSDVASETQLSASGASFADSSDSSLPTDIADLVSNWSVDTAETELDSILSSDLTDKKVVLDAPEILQNPELPTGCESVALTIAIPSAAILRKPKLPISIWNMATTLPISTRETRTQTAAPEFLQEEL